MVPKQPEVLERERREEAERLLKERYPGLKCQVCGGEKWEAGDVAVLVKLLGKVLTPTPKSTPVLPVRCAACGHLLLFAADAKAVNPEKETP